MLLKKASFITKPSQTGKCDWIACYLKPDMAQVFDSLSISKIL